MARMPRTDVAKAADGVWCKWLSGIRVQIAQFNNTPFRRAVQKLVADGEADAEELFGQSDDGGPSEFAARLMADHIVRDWEGIDDEDGNEVPHSADQAFDYLVDPETREFYDFVLVQSQSRALFRLERLEDAKGN